MQRALVVAPYRVARSTWSNELAEWDHLKDLSITVAVGPKYRHLALDPRSDITTINIENFPWLVKHFRVKGKRFHAQWPYDMVIVDESQMLRSEGVRYGAAARIRPAVEIFMELTGTPTPRGLMNLWTQISLLDAGQRLGKDFKSFRDRWFDPPQHQYDDWKAKRGAQEEIESLIRDLAFSLSAEDYLDLPPVMYNVIEIPLSPSARKAYREMRKGSVAQLLDATIIAANKGVAQNKLLQICNGAVYSTKGNWHEVHQEKLVAFGELCKLHDDKPIMALFGYKHDETRLVAELKRQKIKCRVLESKKDEDDWNAGRIPVLLMHPAAGGHGLNLQHGGETIIWFGLTANLEHYLQANARLMGGHRRMGKNVIVNHLTAEDTIEGKTLALLRQRGTDQDRLIAAMRRLILEEEARG
jgi:SNF2 family DNA or RNA helicase